MENGALKYGSNNNNNDIVEEKVVSIVYLHLCYQFNAHAIAVKPIVIALLFK